MSISINGTTGLVFNDASTQNTAATGFGFKNRIINGAMVIDQRNAGASVTATITAAQTYVQDRWAYQASQASKFTIQQNAGSVTLPAGFSNYMGITSSAATSVGAADYFLLNQIVEGYNIADLGWGTANAKTVTVSFLVYSSLTGTFSACLMNGSSNRSYPFTYSVPTANTWTTVTVTVPGDTTGSWAVNNASGIRVVFSLGLGSNFNATANTWTGTSNVFGATGTVSVVGTSGATFYITGVQLEKGSTATSFDYRPYGTELALCQRYLPVTVGGSGKLSGTGQCVGPTQAVYVLPFSTAPRVAPTGFTLSSGVFQVSTATGGNISITSMGLDASTSLYSGVLLATVSSGLVTGNASYLFNPATIQWTGCEL